MKIVGSVLFKKKFHRPLTFFLLKHTQEFESLFIPWSSANFVRAV